MLPAEFLPQALFLAIPARLDVAAGLMLVGHGVPVCPRFAPTVLYIQLSLTVPLAGAIWQVLVQPSRGTARIEPMLPAIQVIPTSCHYQGVTTGRLGINQLRPNILTGGMAWMIWTSRTTPW